MSAECSHSIITSELDGRPCLYEYSNGIGFRDTPRGLESPEDGNLSNRSSLVDLDDSCLPSCAITTTETGNDGWLISRLRRASSAWSAWRSTGSETWDSTSLKWRDKVSNAWNKIKYSEKWVNLTEGDYSSDRFKLIVVLGQFYSPEGSESFPGSGFMDFCRDYYTRLWITYRTKMPPLLESQMTNDCGWGCMIRTTQMAVAQAIVVNRLSRKWRYFMRKLPSRSKEHEIQLRSDPYYEVQLEILKLFEDCPSAPLGIHRLLEISSEQNPDNVSIARWYAPSEVISLVRKALKLSCSPLTSDLSLLLAVDGIVVVHEAERECRHWSKRLLLFVPLRLGANHVNPVYINHIRHMLSLETCLGILGGKPNHSLYFIGHYGQDVIYLDPHVAHEYVPISSWEDISSLEIRDEETKVKLRKHPINTFHSRSYSKMSIKHLDPSCVVGFIFKTRTELDESFRVLNLNQVLDVDLGSGEGCKRTKDPLFTVQYQETSVTDSLRETTEYERQQALEHGFELL